MTQVFDLSDTFVAELCALDPFLATGIGEPGHDDEVTDYSPDGVERRVDLARATLRKLEAAPIENDDDRIAAAVLRDRLSMEVEGFEAGHAWKQLSNFDSPITLLRTSFDLSPRGTEEDWEHLATRMTRVPDALGGFTTSLRHGLAVRQVAARR